MPRSEDTTTREQREQRSSRSLAHPRVRQLFGIDLRSLAALRIGLGLSVLVSLFVRAPEIEALYSDAGVLPRSAGGTMTLYALSGSAAFVGAMFAVAAIFALMLVIGYQTRIATIASWFLTASLDARNPLVAHGGDAVLILLLFWGIFLPLGARASVDARTGRVGAGVPGVALSVGTLAFLMQLVFIYVFSGLLKDFGHWVTGRTAVYEALNLDQLTRSAGTALLGYPGLVKAMSPFIYFVEVCGPLLAFVPVWSAGFRTITIVLFVGFHVVILVLFNFPLFPLFCIVGWLAFLPAQFWDRLARLRLARAVAGGWARLVDWISGGIAALGRSRPWVLAPRLEREASPVWNRIAAALLLLALFANVASLAPAHPLSRATRKLATDLYVGQRWGMFAPVPARDDGWWIAPATLRDGTEIDLANGGSPVVWDRPESIGDTYPSQRWFKFLDKVWRKERHRGKVRHYGEWLRYDWNRRHDPSRHVESMQIYFMLEATQPDYKPPLLGKVMLYQWAGEGTERIVPLQESLRRTVWLEK